MMNEIERIADQLHRQYDGAPWHGTSLKNILGGVDAKQAAARPLAQGHSIWELVLHIAAWKNEVRHRLAGGAAGDPPEGDWPAVEGTSERDWQAAVERLDLAHRLLLSAVRDFPEPNLPTPTNDLRKEGLAPTYYELLLGAIQHDVYHSGQIALLKKST
jgi:uncharacterized damage-inducible protein DinB